MGTKRKNKTTEEYRRMLLNNIGFFTTFANMKNSPFNKSVCRKFVRDWKKEIKGAK